MDPQAGAQPDRDTFVVRLPNDETAPGQARRAVRQALTGWRLPEITDAAVLTASELVTNAVRYGLPPIGLVLRRRVGVLRMDVDDARPKPLKRVGPADWMAESGRGLGLVRELADDHGIDSTPGAGKQVYASWNIADSPPPAVGGSSVDA